MYAGEGTITYYNDKASTHMYVKQVVRSGSTTGYVHPVRKTPGEITHSISLGTYMAFTSRTDDIVNTPPKTKILYPLE